MSTIALTGKDSHIVCGRILNDFASGDCVKIEFEGDLTVVKKGKNGNTIYAKNEMGRIADVTMRILLGGTDDKYMNGLLQEWITDPSTFTLMTGMFVKRVGDGQGNTESKIYNMTGGFFKRQVDAKTSAESDTDQSVAVWRITFGNAQVSIQ